ncbi:hypothetical protein AYO41_04620 [Verrucomicrobia bacterium SCGC AG-212-E04]|nr:hypothetical protein AYO41_04620 [Verrucomicrobia bacterium SCGC AG-212-E04]
MSNQEGQGMGCFAKGCLTLVVVGIAVAAIIGGSLYYYFNKFVDNLTSPTPVAIRVEQPSDAQYNSAMAQLKRITDAYNSGQEITVELTAADLNALIARNPEFAAARGKVFFTIADGNFGAEASIPLDTLPFKRTKGRYFNGKVVAFFEWANGEATFKPKLVEANGSQVPSMVLTQMDSAESQRSFNREFLKDSKTRDAMNRLKTVRLVGEKIVITTKAGPPKK